MAKHSVYFCDVCNKTKTDTNHWYCVGTTSEVVMIVTWDQLSTQIEPKFMRDVEDSIHLCGENCLNKWISSNLPKLHTIKGNKNANTSNEHGNSV